ncbi:hypothetical protein HID58_013271 [Brassica napus]|uniref:Chalcone-flavonone isomerase family protein n=1 Tax=Brassica napus TaxID=3708 RepID=A0ABQ8E3D6_BRANA|nr:hypothetical protein HID58_013271 [Brassica napus]
MFSSGSQLPLPSVTNLQVDSVNFPPSVISPASSNPLFLGGAGIDVVGDKFVITFFGVYLDPVAVPLLSVKWKGKTTELMESVPFFREVVTGTFEKLIKVMMRVPLPGQLYSQIITGTSVKIWKSLGIYTYSEAKAVERFLEVFKDEKFPRGASILFALSPEGSLTRPVLEFIIGTEAASPGTRLSVAERLSQLMNSDKVEEDATKT